MRYPSNLYAAAWLLVGAAAVWCNNLLTVAVLAVLGLTAAEILQSFRWPL